MHVTLTSVLYSFPDYQVQPRQIYTERPRKLQRAVSTPLQSKMPRPVPYPIYTSASTGQFPAVQPDNTIRETYRHDGNNHQAEFSDSEDEIDGPNCMNGARTNANVENEGVSYDTKPDETKAKNYVDKSLSPIHILECRPKKVSDAVCSPEPILNEEEKYYTNNSENEEENELKLNNEKTDINTIKEDEVDGNDIVTNSVAIQEDLESSETFYDSVRAESVFEDEDASFYLSKLDDDDNNIAADGGEDGPSRAQSEQSSHLSDLIDREDEEVRAIREIYLKLLWLTNEENAIGSETVEESTDRDIDETGITFSMIIDILNELVAKRNNSDIKKLIASCYKFFDEKDKKLPLYTCIQNLRDAKNELNSRLLDEMRKTNEMAHDMYLHSQDMKNLEKLKAKITKCEQENSDLKEKLESAEKVKTEQNRRIGELETKLYNLEELRKEEKKAQRRTGISPKRSQVNQGLTPRKQPLYSDPRMAIMQTGYQTTKSPRSQATTSAWRSFKK